MPTHWWAFFVGKGERMFSSLKKLFGQNPSTPAPGKPTGDAPLVAAPSKDSPFLRRDMVFDRQNRLCGRLFRLQPSSAFAGANSATQQGFDQVLIDTLNASDGAWNASLAFIPLNSASLRVPSLERLNSKNVVLLIQL